MKITCPSCEAKYSIADEKVQGKVAKIRCKKCGATIVVGGDGNKAPSAAAAESAGGATYTVNVTEGDQRTMTLAEVVDAYNKGVVTGETYVWAEGMDDWLPLASVPDVMSAVGGSSSAEPSPDQSSEMAAPMHEPEVPVAAARRDPQRSKVDLFGGSGDEPAPMPAPAAASAAPAGGMFGSSSSASNLTGARGEQSVLFSLNALASAAAPPPATSSSKKSTSEDSGLIDLSALAKAAADQSSSAAAPAMALPLNPVLGAPVLEAAPAVAPSSATTPPPAKSNKSGMLIAGGLIFASLVIGGAILFRPQPPAPETTPPPPPPRAARPPPPTPPPPPRGITVVAVHPGWVQTDMGGPAAALTPAESVAGLADVVLGLGPASNGGFLNHDGAPIAW
jgi:predicted Zn finger-like uncharacterized protein